MSFLRDLLRHNASTFLSMGLLVALPLLGSSTLSWVLYQNQQLLQHLTVAQTLLYFALIAFTMAFALTPTTFVALVTGFYLGWWGFPGMVLSYMLAAMIGYTVASSLDRGKMLTFLHHFPKADAVMNELKKDSWQLILLTRISPVLPFALMTFVLAVMGVERKRFLTASVIGMLPRSLFFYWLGTKAQDIVRLVQDPDSGTAGKLLVIGLIAVSVFGLYYLFNKALNRALKNSAKNSS